MAQLPDETALGQRPTPRPAGGVASFRATTGMEGASADAMTYSGAELGKATAALEAYQKQIDETVVQDYYANKFQPDALKIYEGYRSTEGRNAVENLQPAIAATNELRNKGREQFTNDNQRRMYDQLTNRHIALNLDSMANHSNQQLKVWQIDTERSATNSDLAMVQNGPQDYESWKSRVITGALNRFEFTTKRGDVGINRLNARGESEKFEADATLIRYEGMAITNPIQAKKEWYDPDNPSRKILNTTHPKEAIALQHKIDEASTVVEMNAEGNAIVDKNLRAMADKPAATVPNRQGRYGNPREVTSAVQSYLPIIQKYAESTGVDPNILTAQMQQESKGNLMAVSSAGARGVSQFMPDTAKRYGVNVTNADSSISGQARYMADMLKMFDGDYTKALAGYNGGENRVAAEVKRWGNDWLVHMEPETQNYVKIILGNVGTGQQEVFQNTSGLPNARDVMATLPQSLIDGEAKVNEKYGTDPTDPRRIRAMAAMNNTITSRLTREKTQLETIQKKAQGGLIDRIAGFNGKPPISNLAEASADSEFMRLWGMTDSSAKAQLVGMVNSNATKDNKENSPLYWEAFNRIHLPPGDPKKIDFYQDLLGYAGPGKLNAQKIMELKTQLDLSGTVGGKSVSQLMSAGAKRVESAFKSSPISYIPGAASDAMAQWADKAGKTVDEYRNASPRKDVRTLFMYDTPDSLINPKYLQTFMGAVTPAQTLATGSAAVRAGQPAQSATVPPVAQPTTIDSREKLDAWFKTLPQNVTTFIGSDKVTRAIPGRTTSMPNTAVAAPAASPAIINDGDALTRRVTEIDDTLKIEDLRPDIRSLLSKERKKLVEQLSGNVSGKIGAPTGQKAVP